MWSVPTTTRTTTANWYFPTPAPTVRPGPINIPIATQPPAHPGQIGQQPGYPGQSSPQTPGSIKVRLLTHLEYLLFIL